MSRTLQIGSEWRTALVLLLVVVNFAFSIVRANFRTFDPTLDRAMQFSDADTYLEVYFGKGEESRAPLRFLAPYLARLLPSAPDALFGPPTLFAGNRTPDAISRAAFNFAIVNGCFLIGTALVLYFLIRGFGRSPTEAFLGALLLFSLTQVVGSAGGPVADTGYWFFLALGALAVQRDWVWLLLGTALVGVFAKEQVLWLGLLILLKPATLRQKAILLAALVPALLVYLGVRAGSQVTGGPTLRAPSLDAITATRNLFTVQALKELIMVFGTLWLPFLYGLFRLRLPPMLVRWSWFVPAIIVGTRLLGVGSPGVLRHLTAAFIVVIPVAVCGLGAWAKAEREAFIITDDAHQERS